MASWPEIRETLERYEGEHTKQLSDDAFLVTVSLADDKGGVADQGGRAYVEQQVCVRRGLLGRKDGGPGEEYVAIDAAIGAIGDVDLMSVVGHAGQFDHCLLGYAQGTDGGTLSVGTRVPGAFIDVSDPVPFLLLLRTIAATARGVIPELGAEDGFYAFRAEQVRESTWKRIRQFLLNDDSITVERDFGNGFFFLFSGLKEPGRQLRMFVCRREQGVGEHYVTFEIQLGAVQDVDMLRAAEAAATTNGGVVSLDGFVSIRVSEHLTALTPRTFATSILRLVDAAEEYLAPPP